MAVGRQPHSGAVRPGAQSGGGSPGPRPDSPPRPPPGARSAAERPTGLLAPARPRRLCAGAAFRRETAAGLKTPRPAIRGAVAVPAALSSARRAGSFSCPAASPCANRSDVGRGRASTRPPAGGVLLGWRRTRGDGRLGSRACTTPPARGPWASQTHRTVVIETPPVGVGQGGTWKHVLVSSVRRPGHRERRAHVPAERPDIRSWTATAPQEPEGGEGARAKRRPSGPPGPLPSPAAAGRSSQ